MATSRGRIAILVGIVLLAALAAAAIAASRRHTSGQPMPRGPEGLWTLRFSDEFSGSAVDRSKWSDRSSAEADDGHGNRANGQLEWNQAENCSVADGRLTITARPADLTSPAGNHYSWSSCLLTSTPRLSFRYGFLEIRARLPSAKGFWPGFWTWQAAGNERWTETDVFEYHTEQPRRFLLTQHSGEGGECTVKTRFDPSKGFHTYGADIEPDGTDYYVDGKRVCRVPGTSSGPTNVVVDEFVSAQAPPDAGVTGVEQVDYVRVWKRAG